MMYPFLVLTTISMALASPLETMPVTNLSIICETVVRLNGIYYVQSDVKKINGIPADMSLHFFSGDLFFTQITDQMRMSLQCLHANGKIDAVHAAGVAQSSTVDNLNDIVYIATDNGVYKLKDDGTLKLYTALGEDVMYVAVSSDGTVMYIATWPQNQVTKITKEGRVKEVFKPIPNGHGLTIDGRNNIYFVASKTTYVLMDGQQTPYRIKGLPANKMTGVFVTNIEEVFAMDEESNLYVIDPNSASAKRLGSLNVIGVNAFAIDASNNIMIGVKGEIIKFSAFDHHPCTSHGSSKYDR